MLQVETENKNKAIKTFVKSVKCKTNLFTLKKL